MRYIVWSHTLDEEAHLRIKCWVTTREPLLIWGAGALTRRLLATTSLDEAVIAGFVDSNPIFHGKQLAGRPILEPSEIAGHLQSILICSVAFEAEILATLHDKLRLPNRVLMLYR